jgi:hypothetical protein
MPSALGHYVVMKEYKGTVNLKPLHPGHLREFKSTFIVKIVSHIIIMLMRLDIFNCQLDNQEYQKHSLELQSALYQQH